MLKDLQIEVAWFHYPTQAQNQKASYPSRCSYTMYLVPDAGRYRGWEAKSGSGSDIQNERASASVPCVGYVANDRDTHSVS